MRKQYKIKSVFSAFKDCRKDLNRKISKELFKDVCYSYIEFLYKKLLEDGYINIPKLGYFYIKTIKPKLRIDENGKANLPIDWKATKENGFNIYHENLNTEGLVYKIVWSLDFRDLEFPNLYSFKPCRAIKRDLAKRIKNNEINFKTETLYI